VVQPSLGQEHPAEEDLGVLTASDARTARSMELEAELLEYLCPALLVGLFVYAARLELLAQQAEILVQFGFRASIGRSVFSPERVVKLAVATGLLGRSPLPLVLLPLSLLKAL